MYLIFLFVIITFRLCLHLLRLPHVSKCYSAQVEPVKQNGAGQISEGPGQIMFA